MMSLKLNAELIWKALPSALSKLNGQYPWMRPAFYAGVVLLVLIIAFVVYWFRSREGARYRRYSRRFFADMQSDRDLLQTLYDDIETAPRRRIRSIILASVFALIIALLGTLVLSSIQGFLVPHASADLSPTLILRRAGIIIGIVLGVWLVFWLISFAVSGMRMLLRLFVRPRRPSARIRRVRRQK